MPGLRAAARRLQIDPFTPVRFRVGGSWWRLDVAASLYAAFEEQAYVFGERELDAYDHLFFGTHLNALLRGIGDASWYAPRLPALVDVHPQARTDYRKLRGLWLGGGRSASA